MNDPNTVIDKELECSMKWEPAFRELMDQIYWPSYSKKLLEEEPETYYNEYNSFLSLYDEPWFDKK